MDVKIGMVVAKVGAWQRKYRVVSITQDGDYTITELQWLGNHYKDRRKTAFRKMPNREVRCWSSEYREVPRSPQLHWYEEDENFKD